MTTHVYFDLDGTLTDPYEGITKCILYALDELGFPPQLMVAFRVCDDRQLADHAQLEEAVEDADGQVRT